MSDSIKAILLRGKTIDALERELVTTKGVVALQYVNESGFQVALRDKLTLVDIVEAEPVDAKEVVVPKVIR